MTDNFKLERMKTMKQFFCTITDPSGNPKTCLFSDTRKEAYDVISRGDYEYAGCSAHFRVASEINPAELPTSFEKNEFIRQKDMNIPSI